MGFNLHLGSIPKTTFDTIKVMNRAELMEQYPPEYDDEVYPPGVYTLVESRMYELGSDFEILTKCKDHLEDLFQDEDLKAYYNDESYLYTMTEAGFLSLIDYYRESTMKYYKGLFESLTIIGGDTEAVFNFMEKRSTEWEHSRYLLPYDTKKNKNYITTSWEREYSIFELVRLYKLFDFENNILVLSGY